MNLHFSAPCSFAPGLVSGLAKFPEVTELYGKLDRDVVGGGRSTYSLRPVSMRQLERTINEAHAHNIRFNYLLNAAALNGLDQSKTGLRAIRTLLDKISEAGTDAVTVSLPLMLRLVKTHYPQLKTRVGVFAQIDNAGKAHEWEELGADRLCLSAISCNRDFEKLKQIRSSTKCDLELIVNAACLPSCAWEHTHMHLLTQSSRSGKRGDPFCFDYCFVQCARARLQNPVNLLRAVWIRPEDLHFYEALGINGFKLVERSSPLPLLLRRVEAYSKRKFDGNFWELVAPVAQVSKAQDASLRTRIRKWFMLGRPWRVQLSKLLALKKFSETIIPGNEPSTHWPIIIDNRKLDGFLESFLSTCYSGKNCDDCKLCESYAMKAVTINEDWKQTALEHSKIIDPLHPSF